MSIALVGPRPPLDPSTPLVSPIGASAGAGGPGAITGNATTRAASSFADALRGAIEDANVRGQEAARMAEGFASGAHGDIHGTMLALEQAGISMRFLGSVRSRALDAFQELWRTSI